eukprot:403354217
MRMQSLDRDSSQTFIQSFEDSVNFGLLNSSFKEKEDPHLVPQDQIKIQQEYSGFRTQQTKRAKVQDVTLKQMERDFSTNLVEKTDGIVSQHQSQEKIDTDVIQFDYLINLLQKPANDRSQSDLLYIRKYLTAKHLQVFNKKEAGIQYSDDAITQMIKGFNYDYLEANQILFNYGEKGSTFYIIIKGSVNVRIPQDITIEMMPSEYDLFIRTNQSYILEESPENQVILSHYRKEKNHLNQDLEFEAKKIIKGSNQKGGINNKQMQKVNSKEIFSTLAIVQNGKQSLDEVKKQSIAMINTPKPFSFKFMQYITTLKQGDSFGEMALLYNRPRFATIETETDTHFLTLDQKEFDILIKEVQEKQMNEELKTIKKFPIFGQLTKLTLHKLYLYIKIVKLKRGQIVYKEDDQVTHLYLIKSGEFETKRNLKYVVHKEHGLKVLNKRITQSEEKISPQFQSLPVKTKSFKIALTSDLDICCLEENHLQSKTYLTSMECKSCEGVVYQVSREFFKKIKSDEATKMIKQMSQDKVDFLNQRMTQIARAFKKRYQIENLDGQNERSDSKEDIQSQQKTSPRLNSKFQSNQKETISPHSSKQLQFQSKQYKSTQSLGNNYKSYGSQSQLLTQKQNAATSVLSNYNSQDLVQNQIVQKDQQIYIEQANEKKIKDQDLANLNADLMKKAKNEWAFDNRAQFYRNLLLRHRKPAVSQLTLKNRINSVTMLNSYRNPVQQKNLSPHKDKVVYSKVTFPVKEMLLTQRSTQLPQILNSTNQSNSQRSPILKQKTLSPIKKLATQQESSQVKRQLQLVLNTFKIEVLQPWELESHASTQRNFAIHSQLNHSKIQRVLKTSRKPVQIKLDEMKHQMSNLNTSQSRAQTPSQISSYYGGPKTARFSNKDIFSLNQAAKFTDNLGQSPFTKTLTMNLNQKKNSTASQARKSSENIIKQFRRTQLQMYNQNHDLLIEQDAIDKFQI